MIGRDLGGLACHRFAAAAVLSDAVPLSVGGAGPQARLAAARLATALLAGDDLTLGALEVTTTTTQTLNLKSLTLNPTPNTPNPIP